MDIYDFTQTLTSFLAFLTISAHIIVALFVLALIANWILRKTSGKSLPGLRKLLDFHNENILLFCFLVALFGMLGSLYYSEIAHYAPCKLCWTQRIFLYPQVFLLALALKRKSKAILDYTLILTIIGLVIALYHYGIQFIPGLYQSTQALVNCSLDLSAPSCTQYFFIRYGYITDTMMSITAFGLLLIMNLVYRFSSRLK